MFDPSLIHALEMPLPPEPPRMVEERQWLSDAGQRAQRGIERLVSQYETETARWLQTIDEVVTAYARVPRDEKASPSLLASLGDDIAETEALAAYRAKWRARFAKRAGRDVKHWFSVDPSIGAVARAATARLLAADDRVIAGLLDHALFLRSVRSQHDPDPGVSPVYEDPADLLRSLRAAVAA